MGVTTEDRVLDAAKACIDRYGIGKVTIDDISAVSGVSRATLYRLFPGGRDVLFEALRVRELSEFFTLLEAEAARGSGLEDIIVRSVVLATNHLREDEQLSVMLAAEPGVALGQLTVEGLPRITRMATATLTPLVADYLPVPVARRLIDVLARLTISYFLAPSSDLDLGDEDSARRFLRPMITVLAHPTPS